MATTLGSVVIGDVGNLLNSPALHLMVMRTWLERVDLTAFCVDLGQINGSGALAQKVPIWNQNALEAAAVGEGTAITLADFTDTTFTITVAKQAAGAGMSDELFVVAPQGLSIPEIQAGLVERCSMQATDLIAATFPSFTAGPSAGSPMSVGLMYEAYNDFNVLKPPSGQGIMVLSDVQYEQLMSSFRSEGSGDLLWKRDNPIGQALNLMQGYKGSPIPDLHLVNTNRVTTASSNYEAAIIGVPGPDGRGGSIFYKWADLAGLAQYARGPVMMTSLGQQVQALWAQYVARGMIAPNVPPPPIMILIEVDREPNTGETVVYVRFLIGFACDAAKGVRLRSATV